MSATDSKPKTTKNIADIIIAALAASALVGCNANGQLNPQATADLNTALAQACPILNLVQGSNLKLNKFQANGLATLALACPPNPPPTSALVATTDIIAAYELLAPLVNNK